MKSLAAKGRRKSLAGQKYVDKIPGSEESLDNNDDVGVPDSMLGMHKNKRQFSVIKSDETATNPFQQIADAMKHNHGMKQMVQTELQTLKSDVGDKVKGLQGSFSSKIQDMSERLEAVEKYMWRQNMISNMREQHARRQRQDRVRTPSPSRQKIPADQMSNPGRSSVSHEFDFESVVETPKSQASTLG